MVVKGLQLIKNRINLSSGFVHSNDKGCTIELLKKLKKAGYTLDSTFIKTWAINNEFTPSHAEQLKEFVDGVNTNKAYRIGKTPYWKENIVKLIEDSIE